VLAGNSAFTAGARRTIGLQSGSRSEVALTPARVGQIVTNVSCNFGPAGSATLTTFDSPERVWWRSAQVICCRYRLPIGAGGLEAVVDIHAFAANNAFVEVVVENGKLNSASPVKPTTKVYTNATVAVNGTTLATVSSPVAGQAFSSPNGNGTYAGGHEAFRAWYCSGWVAGDPGVTVTHDTASMQAHPLFHKMARASTANMASRWSGATFDTYQPWRPCRVRVPNMGGVADYEEIGPYTLSQSDYLQTGNVTVAGAIVQHALGVLCTNVNYRDAASGVVTTLDGLGTKSENDGSWPSTNSEPGWEIAHHPSHGLMAFLLRPSPCFIEIAQKIVVWNKQWSNLYSFSPNHPGDVGTTGTYGLTAQTRGKAWSIRSHSHAAFLTPDGHPWKAGARIYLHGAFRVLNTFRVAPNERLGAVYNDGPMPINNLDYSGAMGFETPMWQSWFLTGEVLKVAAMRFLTGSDQKLVEDVAGWLGSAAARYVNESAGGEWRFHPYLQTIGTANGSNRDMGQSETWGVQIRHAFGGAAPPSVAGYWLSPNNSGNWATTGTEIDQSANVYVKAFVYALALAKERGISGAAAAWATVNANIINIDTWKSYWGTDARWGAEPRG
jgi:hypothetical protein